MVHLGRETWNLDDDVYVHFISTPQTNCTGYFIILYKQILFDIVYKRLQSLQEMFRNNFFSLYCWWSQQCIKPALMAASWKHNWPQSSLQWPSSFQREGRSIHVFTQGQCYAEINRLCGGTGVICASICCNQTVWVRQQCVVLWMESQSTLETDSPTLCVVVFSSFTAFSEFQWAFWWCMHSWPTVYPLKFCYPSWWLRCRKTIDR